MSTPEKSFMRARYEHLIYWSSIGMDAAIPGKNPGIYVLGYIKSGTNWLCHLLSAALDTPILEPWKMSAPTLEPRIFHMHRFIPLDSVRKRTIYLIRDGRDTMVSRYFHIANAGGIAKIALERELGTAITADRAKENMAGFIRFMTSSNIASRDYRSHILEWKKHRDKYITMRYEDMLADTTSELARAVESLTHKTPDNDMIRRAVQQHDFTRLTKRKKGEEDHKSFIRKGVSGDWRNYFTAESAHVFDEYAGDLLLELGYENDPEWASKVS